MARIRKRIHIQAPVQEVFSYVADPANRLQFWPGLIWLTDIEPLPGGGHTFRWMSKIAGARVDGTGQTIRYVPGRFAMDRHQGGVSSLVTWRCDPERDGTRFIFDYQYKVHVPFLKRRSDPFLFKVIDCHAEMLVVNVKAHMEAACAHHADPSPVGTRPAMGRLRDGSVI